MFFTKINHHCSEERQGLSHASSRTAAAPIIFCTNTLRAFLNCSHSCSCTSSTTTTMKGLIPPCPHQQHHLHHHQRHRQQCQQQRHTLSVIRNSRSRSTAAIAAAAAPELGQHSTHAEPQHAAQSSRATQQQQQQQQQQTDTRRGRLLIKQQPGHGRSPSSSRLDDLQQALPASLHQLRGPMQQLQRGSRVPQQQQQQQQPSQHADVVTQLVADHQHPHQLQQQQPPLSLPPQAPPRLQQQSLRDKNLSFSGALRGTKTLVALLELLQNPQWGPSLCDLDGVSVVGALVWLVKSREWQQLQQQQGAVGQEQRQLKQAGLLHIQTLLDRAEDLVLAQNSSSSNGNGAAATNPASGGSAAGAAAAAVPAPTHPMLIRPAELANLIYVTSKLQQQRPQLLAAAAAGLQLDLYACSTVELNRLIWGLASARLNPGDAWMLGFCKAAQAKFGECSNSQLSTLVYGAARLGYRPPDVWIAAWLEVSLPLLGRMNAQQLANSAWGLSCFRFQAPPGWLDAFYAASSATMTQQAPQGISQLAIALVTLAGGQAPPQVWAKELLAAAQPLLHQLELLQLCNLGWALANWQLQPEEEWMGEWVDASLLLLPTATPVDLSVLLWSCFKLNYVPPQSWLEAWFASTAASLPRCEPLQLATMSKVMGEWGLVPTPGFSADYWRVTKSRFPEFTGYQLSVLLWGLGQARRAIPTSWATALMVNFTQQLPDADPGDVCRFIGALSRVVVKPRGAAHWVSQNPAVQQQLQQVVAWLLPQVAGLEPGWLFQLVLGLQQLRCVLDGASVEGLNDAAARMDERLAPAQRKALASAFKALRELSQQHGQQLAPAGQQSLTGGRRRARASSSSAAAEGSEWLPQQPSQQSMPDYWV